MPESRTFKSLCYTLTHRLFLEALEMILSSLLTHMIQLTASGFNVVSAWPHTRNAKKKSETFPLAQPRRGKTKAKNTPEAQRRARGSGGRTPFEPTRAKIFVQCVGE